MRKNCFAIILLIGVFICTSCNKKESNEGDIQISNQESTETTTQEENMPMSGQELFSDGVFDNVKHIVASAHIEDEIIMENEQIQRIYEIFASLTFKECKNLDDEPQIKGRYGLGSIVIFYKNGDVDGMSFSDEYLIYKDHVYFFDEIISVGDELRKIFE